MWELDELAVSAAAVKMQYDSLKRIADEYDIAGLPVKRPRRKADMIPVIRLMQDSLEPFADAIRSEAEADAPEEVRTVFAKIAK